jgi:hypothetical protein
LIQELEKNSHIVLRNPQEGISKLVIFSSKNSQTGAQGFAEA